MLKDIDKDLTIWGDWTAKLLESSPLSPHDSPISQFGLSKSLQPAHALVPDVVIPPRAQYIDRALRDAPARLHDLAMRHYVAKEKPRSRRRRYEELDRLHYWVLGWRCAHSTG